MSKHKRKQRLQAAEHDQRAVAKHDAKQEEFVSLYQSDDAEGTVDMTTLVRGSAKQRFFIWIIGLVVVLSVVAMTLGYFVFSKNRLVVTPGEVAIELSAPTLVSSGDQLTVTVEYHNDSAATIQTGSIELVMPDGFYVTESDPEAAEGTTNHWDVQDVPPGADGTITVTGQLIGQTSDQKTFTSLFTYSPVNFSSNFQTSANTTVTVGESIMKLDVTAPEQVRSGEEMQYVFTVTNSASLPLVNAKAKVQYPAGFSVTSTDPAASQANSEWLFEEIEPNGTEEVTVKGTMAADAKEKQEFVLQVGIEQSDGLLNLQAEDRRTIKVINPEVSLKVTAPASASAGETIQYDITVSNPSKVELADLVLTLAFAGGAIDGNAATLDTIANLAPGEEAQLTYKATLKDPLPSSATNIVATLSVDSALVGGEDTDFTDQAEVTTTLQGTLELSAEGRYFSDDLTKIGSGPVPPEVGTATTYVIRWTLTSGSGAMSDAVVETTLPAGVEYAGSGDDQVSYDAGTGVVSWSFKQLEAGDSKTASFSVEVTPKSSDVGKLLVLTKEAIATATDANSAAAVQSQAKQITSNLANDPGVDDDGVVVE